MSINEKIIIIHKIGLNNGVKILLSGPVAKTNIRIDITKNEEYEISPFKFL